MKLGILCGLASEARVLERAAEASGARLRIAHSAAREARAGTLAAELAAEDLDALVSFGLAGGLHPALRPGQLVAPRRVHLLGGESVEVDAGLHERLLALAEAEGVDLRVADVAGASAPARTPEDKHTLAAETGCGLVDMESHVLAAQCRRNARPLIVLRAVVDAADMRVPAAALAAVDTEGRARLGPVLIDVLRRPARLPAYLSLARANARALAALGEGARLLCRLCLDDPGAQSS